MHTHHLSLSPLFCSYVLRCQKKKTYIEVFKTKSKYTQNMWSFVMSIHCLFNTGSLGQIMSRCHICWHFALVVNTPRVNQWQKSSCNSLAGGPWFAIKIWAPPFPLVKEHCIKGALCSFWKNIFFFMSKQTKLTKFSSWLNKRTT